MIPSEKFPKKSKEYHLLSVPFVLHKSILEIFVFMGGFMRQIRLAKNTKKTQDMISKVNGLQPFDLKVRMDNFFSLPSFFGLNGVNSELSFLVFKVYIAHGLENQNFCASIYFS